MKDLIKYFKKHVIFIGTPFLCYFTFKVFLATEYNSFEKYSFGFGCLFFFILFISTLYFLTYHTEKIDEHQNNSSGRRKFLAHTMGVVILLSLTFASYYWCIFDYNNLNFTNVSAEKEYLDFILYSFGIFIMNNTSQIQAKTFYAKFFVGTEMLAAFITLILILANYKDLKDESLNKK
ncbi:hypothetical protein G9H64_13030 [Aquirufa nivalisilvae]|uniref:hypothetical protein n=1 Tax=Aquirufa nivalisilvae TaxID=2516557 RepID=UPI0010328B82|nr:hypothetical protein [Aquirufa nivalisilvae]MCZ2481231.1 hypothetical protein [Aquirufa nivalisilvae]MCZ2483884.1 hypothetical protein [Aquirufa nivalisilvae]TBH73969.1 hypothetical protein EWU22_09955 [Aquirufa nivalisilvae]